MVKVVVDALKVMVTFLFEKAALGTTYRNRVILINTKLLQIINLQQFIALNGYHANDPKMSHFL